MLRPLLCLAAVCMWHSIMPHSGSAAEPLTFNQGDKIVVIGNTLAERQQYYNNFETLLHARFPDKQLVYRNLGWSGDSITLRLRSQDFQDHGHTLIDHQPNVIFAFFGYNESFAGEAGIPAFKQELEKFLAGLKQLKYPTHTYPVGKFEPNEQDKQGEVKVAPRIILFSPIANEDLPGTGVKAATRNNKNIALYVGAMEKVAAKADVQFVNLFQPTEPLLDDSKTQLTINGCHLTDAGDEALAKILDQELFGTPVKTAPEALKAIKKEITEKNKQFFYDYRAVNGYYIYGGRKKPFGVVNFPPEFEKLRKMIANRDQRVWGASQGKQLPAKIDDSNTGELPAIETNFTKEIAITPPQEALKSFTVAEGFEVNLFASEVEFPELQNPVSMTFDAEGRIWVTTNAAYPQYLPGVPVNDKILILSDKDGDGKADHQQIFAENLYIPIGVELADGGAYVSAQPNMLFLKDTDGDGKADKQEYVLHGLDSGDSHHALHAFEWGPGGELYFAEGIFHHSQIESPFGLTRSANAAVYRFDPKSSHFSNFVSYTFANPWGQIFDKWGQNLIADASGGNNYIAGPFSGDIDFPRKHPGMKQFLEKQWRPTCGCEIVSSRNFPDEMQGDFLLNNCIGFQGVLQYRLREEGSGYHADPVSPLLRSSDPNFRPVDIQFGPDGALYLLDWYNPLVGHMQHSIRDPNRSKIHGRIWRISYKGKPLVKPAKIAGESEENLVKLLSSYEDRTRYRVRRELRDRDPKKVVAAVDQWIAQLSPESADYERMLLEGFWVKQQVAVLDVKLLNKLLEAKSGHARAAAVRAVSYSIDQLDQPLEILQKAVNDEFPRVRLEAIRALSFFDSQEALDVTVEALLHEQDVYLEYVFKETQETLQRRISAKTSESK
ncbi:PVC-type heme-binding CxxCH protein [Planctomicrobium sp. SH527]|uniref:PVC-type heme-binding CxxCH protein n=1 Tax=Planctomicrobium sp. SH527 TaxID=3448123 RepID=UPI003F5B3B32